MPGTHCTPTASRRLRHDELVERMTTAVGLTLTQRCCLWCGNIARTDTVALNVVLAIFRTNVTRQHFQTAFSGCVGGDRLTAELTHH